MNLKQSFRMAFKSIRANRVRSLLTMLGIIIGVAAVIIMVSVVQGSNRQLKEYYERLGNNRITVSAEQWGGMDISRILYDYCLSLGPLVYGVTSPPTGPSSTGTNPPRIWTAAGPPLSWAARSSPCATISSWHGGGTSARWTYRAASR